MASFFELPNKAVCPGFNSPFTVHVVPLFLCIRHLPLEGHRHGAFRDYCRGEVSRAGFLPPPVDHVPDVVYSNFSSVPRDRAENSVNSVAFPKFGADELDTSDNELKDRL